MIEIGLVVIAIFSILWFYFEAPVKRGKLLAKKIPGPKPLPIIGNLLELRKEPKGFLQFLLHHTRKYGKIFKIQLPGRMMIILTDPKDIEILLRNNEFLEKPDFVTKNLAPWLGKGLLLSHGDMWREQRKLITPTFHFNILEKFFDVFNDEGDVLMKILREKATTKENINIFPLLQLFALDVICETAMGQSVHAQTQLSENEYVDAVQRMEQILTKINTNFLYQIPFIFRLTKLGREFDKCLKTIKNTSNNVIRRRRDQLVKDQQEGRSTTDDGFSKKRMAFLDLLLQARKSNGEALTNKEISDEVDTFMAAGHDTTSTQMSFLLYLLSNRPDIQEELYREQTEILDDMNRNPTFKECQDMHYLERCIKEGQRLLGSVVLFSRKMTGDLPLSKEGVVAPKDSNLTVFVYQLHRDPEIWPEPDNFDPDRFLPENIHQRSPYAFVPFSAGPRNCIGQKFAMLEMKACVSSIIRHFKITPAYEDNGDKFEPDLRFITVLSSENGILVRLTPRK